MAGRQIDRKIDTDRQTDGNLLGCKHMSRRYFFGLLLYSDSKSYLCIAKKTKKLIFSQKYRFHIRDMCGMRRPKPRKSFTLWGLVVCPTPPMIWNHRAIILTVFPCVRLQEPVPWKPHFCGMSQKSKIVFDFFPIKFPPFGPRWVPEKVWLVPLPPSLVVVVVVVVDAVVVFVLI